MDVDAPGAYAVLDFWEPIELRGSKRLILDPDEFYILASKEAVHVPPDACGRDGAVQPDDGRIPRALCRLLRSGLWHAAAGGTGAKAVLEVRSHEIPFVLEDGQIIGRLVYERLAEVPEVLYGSDLGSNYQAQGLKLSKHFK